MASFRIDSNNNRLLCPKCGDDDLQVIHSRIEVKEGKVTKKRKGDTIRIEEGGCESNISLECFCRSCSTDTDYDTGEVVITYYTLKTVHENGKLIMKWNSI